jgi:16S rRNA processing protein RimM
MEYVYVGTLVNTHGIKGEVRLVSDFEYKKLVFIPNFKLYIGKSKDEVVVNTYRAHKNFDMLTFAGINNINDVLKYKGDYVYALREDINHDGYFKEDLIGMEVYSNNKLIGSVKEIMKSKAHDILVILGNKKYMVPFIDEFINNVDTNKRIITVNEIGGLFNEN